MLRSTVSKVVWVGRATVFLAGLAVILALLFGVTSIAFAGNGDAWLLGRNNTASNTTRLAGGAGVDGAMLRITNNNGGTNDTALALVVQSGEPPMRVNSSEKVVNLNADEVDGRDSSEFFTGATYLLSETATNTTTTDGTISLQCDTGDIALSGGFSKLGASNSFVVDNRPDPETAGGSPTGWYVSWRNMSAVDEVTGYVVCADFPPARTP
jgi:hypothetical protein